MVDGDSLQGCVVTARLGSQYFVSLNPANVVITGRVLVDFMPADRRRLLRDIHIKRVVKFGTEVSIVGNGSTTDPDISTISAAALTSHYILTVLIAVVGILVVD